MYCLGACICEVAHKEKQDEVRQTQDAVSLSGEWKRNAHKQEPDMPCSQVRVWFPEHYYQGWD